MRKVVVITRTKDRPEFLVRAVRSVQNQTYKDYLHLIVNDGGKASQVNEVMKPFIDDECIQVHHRPESSNAPDTIFNECIDMTDSKYVAIHDDDDTWHKEFLERTVSVLENGSKAVVVKTDKIIEKNNSGTLVELKRQPYMPDLRFVSLYRQCIDNQMTPIATLFSRTAYEAVGKFDTTLPVVGDWEFGLRFLSSYDVEFLDPGFPLAYYHHRKAASDNSFASHDGGYYINKVANRMLREELKSGVLGIGFLISKLRYDQHDKAEMVRKVLPRFVTSRLQRRIQR